MCACSYIMGHDSVAYHLPDWLDLLEQLWIMQILFSIQALKPGKNG